jgi:hypothetical protein
MRSWVEGHWYDLDLGLNPIISHIRPYLGIPIIVNERKWTSRGIDGVWLLSHLGIFLAFGILNL